MAAPKAKRPSHTTSADSTQAVNDFMAKLDHPLKKEIEAIRKIILQVDPGIAEGIKWNAPSFRTTEYFATTNLRAKNGVGIILHLGAKVRELRADFAIADPAHLLKWLGKDRATVEFSDLKDIAAKKAALTDVLRHWIGYIAAS